MNVSLTPELERLIQARVATGMYNNASEVVREALRMLFEKEMTIANNRNRLLSDLDRVIESAEQGQFYETSVDAIFDEVIERNKKQESA